MTANQRVSSALRYFGAAMVGIIIFAVIYFLLYPLIRESFNASAPDVVESVPQDPTEDDRRLQRAVKFAVDSCQLQQSETEKRSITVDTTYSLAKGGGGGDTNTQKIRSAYDISLSENGKLTVDKAVRDCMVKQTAVALGLARSGSSAPAMAERNDLPPAPVSGYIYYEEQDGKITEDGVFSLANVEKLPPYADLKRGDVLRANSTARMRADPTTESAFVSNIFAGECVRVADKPRNALQGFENATSGGRVFVQSAPCPKLPTKD